MTYSYDKNTDTYYYHMIEAKNKPQKRKSKLSKGRNDIIEKLVAKHRKNKTAKEKREDKISDLQSRSNSWKNLE